MISARMIEGLLELGFHKAQIELIIENDYKAKEEVLREDMLDSLDSLSTQCAVRKISEALKKERE
jgi:hypothetical protein